MAVKQISVFIDNKVGGLASVADELTSVNVNVQALSVVESADFAVVRMVVNDVDAAAAVMRKQGHIYNITEVVGVGSKNKPGSIAKIARTLAEKNISIDYAYALFTRSKDDSYLIIHVENNEEAEQILKEKGIHILTDEELSNL